jgi:methionyl-tRNA synthetase
VEVPYFLSKYDPDPLRFYLTAPEMRDTEFSWEDFVERNNNELVATWGNLANARGYSGPPERYSGPPEGYSGPHAEFRLQALRRPGAGAGQPFEFLRAGPRCQGPGAPGEGRGRLRDRGHAVQRLQVPRRPFGLAQGRLFGTQQVVEYQEETRSHQALTYDHSGAIGTWALSALPPGQALWAPAPLFRKLDESLIEEECARLEASRVAGAGKGQSAKGRTRAWTISPVRCIIEAGGGNKCRG